MKKRLIIATIFILSFTTFNPKNFSLKTNFNINEIIIENNFILREEEIKKNLAFLYNSNIFFLRSSNITNILTKNSFIESFEIKKIYPSKIKIKVFERKPIAILQNKKEKFFISENIKLIDYKNIKEFENLPFVFGNKENFKIFYKYLKKLNFPLEIIKNYYFFDSGRWDLEIYEDKIVKLPIKNYVKSLKNFMDLKDENNFNKYKVFDYRINEQLILK